MTHKYGSTYSGSDIWWVSRKLSLTRINFQVSIHLSQLIHSSLSQELSKSTQQSEGQGLNKELSYLGPHQSLSRFSRTGVGIPVYRRVTISLSRFCYDTSSHDPSGRIREFAGSCYPLFSSFFSGVNVTVFQEKVHLGCVDLLTRWYGPLNFEE